MAEQIKFGDRLFLAGEKVVLDNGTTSPKLEARNGELVIGYNTVDPQSADHHVIIKGDLTVEGTTTTVNTEVIKLADPFILLNGDITDTIVPSEDVGIEINRGSESNKKFGWDETNDQWVTYDETLNLGSGNLIAADINAVNVTLSGALTAASSDEHRIGNYTFNENIMSVVSGDTEIHSPSDISFYPQENIWISQGTKLIFEGTAPDEFEAKLQATSVTEDRDIILPDESGTLALQEWTTREIDALTTDDIEEGVNNLYYTEARVDTNFVSKSTDDLSEGNNLYYTDDRVQTKLGDVSGHILPDTDVAYDLGSPTKQFRDLYLSGNTIYMDGTELSVDGTTNNFNITNEQGTTETFASVSYVDDLVANAVTNGTIDLSGYTTDAELSTALSNLPLFDGAYSSLSGTPTLFDGAYSSLTGSPTIPSDVSDLADTANLIFSGSYSDLVNKPVLFDGAYSSLTGSPTIPSDVSDLTDSSNLLGTDFTGYATQTYVDTQVANLVDSAPSTLDTLNELSTALNNDANFANTVTASIASKADSTTVTNLQNTLTAELGTKAATADLATVSTTGAYSDLLSKPTTVSTFSNDAGYITPSTLVTDFGLLTDPQVAGQGSNVNATIINVSSFNNDSGYLVASDLSTVATSGSYNDLINKPALFSGSYNDLTNKPALFSGTYNDLTNKPALFNGQYSSLVGSPTQLSDFTNDNNFVKHSTDDDIVPKTDDTYDLGSASNQWKTIYGHTVESTYADLAERYAADASYEPGTVLIFGGEYEITTTTLDTDVSVAGVVSTDPAVKMNSAVGNSDTHPYIALRGRVPCKIVGPVKKGELLVTSSTPGVARSVGKIDMGIAVFAKALETDYSDGEKVIEVVII
jgi:hypothetical protein